MKPLNPWLPTVLRKSARLFEDSDRKTFAAGFFQTLIRRVNTLATLGAHATPEPKLERLQFEGETSLIMEWLDPESGWFLCFGVRRRSAEKPRYTLEFSGNPKSYSTEKPTDDEIRQALHDYFQDWKK